MNDENNQIKGLATRRQMARGAAIAIFSLAAGSRVWGQQTMKEVESTGADGKRTYLHQEIQFKAKVNRIYEVLLDSKQFAAFTGHPAEIDPKEGGVFSMFKGMIVGRNIELICNQRIVQAWRPASWGPGVYSVVKFELKEMDEHTKLILDHTGFPEGNYGHLNSGWHARYWEPLKRFLA